jgi:hypothetical protein
VISWLEDPKEAGLNHSLVCLGSSSIMPIPRQWRKEVREMRLGKEDWTAWVKGSDLERLRAFWNAIYASGGPPVKRLNVSQSRGILTKYLEERPDDWEFEWVPQQETEAEPAIDETIVEEKALTQEETEMPEKTKGVEKKTAKRRISWYNVFLNVISGFLALAFGLIILSAMGFSIKPPVWIEKSPATPIIPEPSPTFIPESSPTIIPESTHEETVAQKATVNSFASGWKTEWYWSPFRDVTDTLEDEATRETFAEPGVLLDDTAAFDYLSATETPINAPEGGFAYIAVGSIKLSYDGYGIDLPAQANNIYLIIIRGLPDDATDADLNQQVWATHYPRGFGIYSPMPTGAYVSLGWFLQQIENAQESSGDPNCGADGCDQITVVVIELQSLSYRLWKITGDSRDWIRVQ